MKKTKCFLPIAAISFSGFFACNTAPQNPAGSTDSLKLTAENAKAAAQPFNCATSKQVPLGYVDTGWVYQNSGLGVRFEFPKGWNAMDDIFKSSPTFVPVGGNYYEFRESYLKPRFASLEGMIRDGWNDPRFMFGFTHMIQPVYNDTLMPNYYDSVYAAAYLFYSDHASEKALYEDLVSKLHDLWKQEDYASIRQLNQNSVHTITGERVGRDTFYTQVLKTPAQKGILYAATSIKRKGCLFIMLIFHYYNEKEHEVLLDGMKGLSLSNV